MCGRYTLSAPGDVLSEVFDVTAPQGLSPRYNIAPTQEAAVVRVTEPGAGRSCDLLRWGLVPFWAKDPGIGNKMINARAETAAEKPAFRNSFKKMRCLVPADGFYEWKKQDGAKQPYWIHLTDGRPFAFAGLWSHWDKDKEAEPLTTYTLLTTDAHERIAEVHHRMPVILRREVWDVWLDPQMQGTEELTALLTNEAGAYLDFHPVSRQVNSPANDSPECIVSVA
jgi:putative SOS response-associated peptidase YedK